ncbi:hypothetical protein FLL62_14595 [Vibrio cholerae]|nr:hypothetical protein FLL62_14595 [Vibrio cholerae]
MVSLAAPPYGVRKERVKAPAMKPFTRLPRKISCFPLHKVMSLPQCFHNNHDFISTTYLAVEPVTTRKLERLLPSSLG